MRTVQKVSWAVMVALASAAWASGSAQAAEFVPLATLRPSAVVMKFVRQKTPVRMLPTVEVVPGLRTDAVEIPVQAAASYAIPAGARSFTGILAYTLPPPAAVNALAGHNRIRMRLLVDGREVFCSNLDKHTPPEEFTVPVGPGRVLTVKTDGEMCWDRVYLARAGFAPAAKAPARRYLLAAGTGYVELSPGPRQAFFHVYRPGEKVAAGAFFGGTAATARVTVDVRPEGDAPASSATMPVELRTAGPGLTGGFFAWQVPNVRGPAQVEVREEVAGQTVYAASFRIAIAPEVDLARIEDSPFGVHLSGWGFSFLADDFANLWGAKWGRVFVRWDFVEPEPGKLDFARMDELVDLYAGQHMRILGVLGEKMPAWAATPGAEQDAALRRFVETTVRRYHDKIQYWDVFNEVDNKYHTLAADAYKKGDNVLAVTGDLNWLRDIAETVHRVDPQAKTVGWSTGSSGRFLAYDKRTFDAGLLEDLDVVALHPYMHVAPEFKDGPFNFLEQIDALRELVGHYRATRPVWATEANYLIGRAGDPDVTAPDIDEHTQAAWVVRVNLLTHAAGAHYFLHSPYYTSHHPELYLDTLAAYAQMASMFSGAAPLKPECLGGGSAFVVAARQGTGVVGALWTPLDWARVRVRGGADIQWFDFYGNPLLSSPDDLPLTGAPVYFRSAAAEPPTVQLVRAAKSPAWHPAQPLETWRRAKDATYQPIRGGLHVVSGTTTYGYQLTAAPMAVTPGSRYVFRINARVLRGMIGWQALNPATNKRIEPDAYVVLPAQGDRRLREVHLTIHSKDCRSLQLLICGANSMKPDIAEFEVSSPEFQEYPPPHDKP